MTVRRGLRERGRQADLVRERASRIRSLIAGRDGTFDADRNVVVLADVSATLGRHFAGALQGDAHVDDGLWTAIVPKTKLAAALSGISLELPLGWDEYLRAAPRDGEVRVLCVTGEVGFFHVETTGD